MNGPKLQEQPLHGPCWAMVQGKSKAMVLEGLLGCAADVSLAKASHVTHPKPLACDLAQECIILSQE